MGTPVDKETAAAPPLLKDGLHTHCATQLHVVGEAHTFTSPGEGKGLWILSLCRIFNHIYISDKTAPLCIIVSVLGTAVFAMIHLISVLCTVLAAGWTYCLKKMLPMVAPDKSQIFDVASL